MKKNLHEVDRIARMLADLKTVLPWVETEKSLAVIDAIIKRVEALPRAKLKRGS